MTEPRIVDHLYIANSTWIYNYFTGNDSDSFQVRITGSLDGVEKGCITETLVAGKSKLSGWRKVVYCTPKVGHFWGVFYEI